MLATEIRRNALSLPAASTDEVLTLACDGQANEWNSGDNGSERYFIEVWEEPKFEGRIR